MKGLAEATAVCWQRQQVFVRRTEWSHTPPSIYELEQPDNSHRPT